MAIPTLTTLTPATGPASGHTLVTLTGTNFRTRTGVLGPQASPVLPSTVKVTIGGYQVLYAHAVSATEIAVLTCPCRQDPTDYPETFPALSVVVQNLDDSGVLIPTETVTKTLAWTYVRAQLAYPAPEPPLLQVITTFLRRLKREIWREAVIKTSPDFGDEFLTYSVLADLPAIVVSVDMPRDPIWSQYDNEPVLKAQTGHWHRYRPSRTYKLIFRLVLAAKTGGTAHRMLDAALGTFMDSPELVVAGDARWSTDENKYPLDILDEPKTVAVIGDAGTEAFSLTVQVSGVPLMPSQPMEDIYPITQIYLALANMNPGSAAPVEVAI
jgi:hypothetical protein